MNYKLLLLLFNSLLILIGCDKKEILTGKRHNIDGIVYKEFNIVQSFPYKSLQNNTESSYLNANPKIIWYKNIKTSPIMSNIIVADGYVYAINGQGVLHCIDKKTGQLQWTEIVAPQLKEGRFVGGMAYYNGIIYIGTNVNTLIAFNAITRKYIWRKVLDNSVKGIPLYHNGKIIFTSADNQTFVLNAYDGKPIWAHIAEKSEIAMTQLGSPVIFKNNVICVYSNGEIISFNLKDWSINWSDVIIGKYIGNTSSIITNIATSPIIIGDKCLVINAYSQMVLFDAASGVRIWEKNIGSISQPLLIEKNLVFALCDNYIICISIENGDILWKFNINDLFKDKKEAKTTKWYGPLLVNNQLWIFSNSAYIAKFDLNNGKCINKQYIHHLRHSIAPIIVDKNMYSLANGSIYALR